MVKHLLAVIYTIIPALTTILSSEKLSYCWVSLWTGDIPTASHFTSAPIINMIFIMLALSEVTRTQTTCQNCHLKFQQFSSKSLWQLSLLCQREPSFVSNGNCSSLDKWWYDKCTLGVHPDEYTYLTYHLIPPLFYTLYSSLPGCFIFATFTRSRFCTFYHDRDYVWNSCCVNFHKTLAFPSFQNFQNTHLLNKISSHKQDFWGIFLPYTTTLFFFFVQVWFALVGNQVYNIQTFKVRPVASIQ